MKVVHLLRIMSVAPFRLGNGMEFRSRMAEFCRRHDRTRGASCLKISSSWVIPPARYRASGSEVTLATAAPMSLAHSRRPASLTRLSFGDSSDRDDEVRTRAALL